MVGTNEFRKLVLFMSTLIVISTSFKVATASELDAEPIRLLLHAAEVTFEETRFESCPEENGEKSCPSGVEDWPSFKEKHAGTDLLPFGQVPSLTLKNQDGEALNLVQSLAIQKLLGKKLGFIYEQSEEIEARADMIVGGLLDVRRRYGQFAYNKDVLINAKLVQEYKNTLKTWLSYFESLLGSNEWFIGNKMTYVDTLAFDMLESNLRIDIVEDCLKNLPKLRAFTKRVANVPGIKKYLQSSSRLPFSNGAFAAYDTPNNPIDNVPDFFDTRDEL